MAFNGTKFQLLRYGRNTNLKATTHYLDSQENVIPESPGVKDLGVWMTPDGKFTDHIRKVVKSAWCLTGWVLRTFSTRDEIPMMTLYKSLILSKLDYCSPLWNPPQRYLCQEIEQVQRASIHQEDMWPINKDILGASQTLETV
jgi:hypothetical protein